MCRTMKRTVVLVFVVMFATVQIWAQGQSADEERTTAQALRARLLDVGTEKQLFIDELFFDSSHNVSLKLNPALKTKETNVTASGLWETRLNWFSVMEDQGKYKMWYECYGKGGTYLGYAESTDGIGWTKPGLGLYEYEGSKANNILFKDIGPEDAHSRVHGTGIFLDPAGPPEQRYKGVSQGAFSAEEPHRISWGTGKSYYNVAGMYSADGLNWMRLPKSICHTMADSQYSCFWDASIGKYVLYGRVGGNGRSLGRSESKDFTHFDTLTLVLQTDEKDPPDSDLYNPAALKYPCAANAYLMFASLYQHRPDTLDIRLAVSRNGINWTWPDRNKAFIPLGEEEEFDCGSLYMGQGMIRKGNELWQYYGGSSRKHGGGGPQGQGRIYSRVISRLDGYVSVEADAKGGSFTTPPLTFDGNTLYLNAKVRPGGSVRVGLLDENSRPIEGRSIEDCVPITGDDVEVLVSWKANGGVIKRAGKKTRLQIEMTNASLYSFQFVQAYPYRM